MKKIIATLLVTVLALTGCLFLTGCVCSGCAVCSQLCTCSCLADGLEFYGDCSDCATVLCNVVMGEQCTDSCYVGSCYMVANGVRHCSPNCDCNIAVMEDYTFLNADQHTKTYSATPKRINNLTEYYQVDVDVLVTALVELKNVWVVVDVRDANGNLINDCAFYVAGKIKVGEGAVRGTTHVTFAYPEIKNRISISDEEDYWVEVTNVRVYARI